MFPAFFALYVSYERRSSVQAMQLSNGLADPIGLWLGHLMFDGIFATVSATLIIIIFAGVAHQLHGLGFFVSFSFDMKDFRYMADPQSVIIIYLCCDSSDALFF